MTFEEAQELAVRATDMWKRHDKEFMSDTKQRPYEAARPFDTKAQELRNRIRAAGYKTKLSRNGTLTVLEDK